LRQVLLHESSWNAVVASLENGAEPKDIVFRNMGSHTLKGITRKVHIIQAIPAALASRSFPQIKTKSAPLNLQRPSGPKPFMKLGELDSYLADVGGIALNTEPKLPAREVGAKVVS
jgi:hypothetical protein